MSTVASEMLDQEILDEVRRIVNEETQEGLEGAELAVGLNGELAFSEGFGKARPDTPIVLMSPSKTVLASGLCLALGDGLLDLDARVAKYLPPFGGNGKDAVTIRQIMTHTSGFPNGDLDWPEWRDREARLAAYGRFELEYEPGTRYHYHPAVGAWVLADVIHATTGHDHREFLRKRLFEPLGIAGVRGVSLGEPVDEQRAVLTHRFNLSEDAQAHLPPNFRQDGDELQIPGGLGLPEGRAVGFPGAGCVATAQGMALLYQALLHNPNGLWEENVLRAATRETAIEMQARWDKPIKRALSVFIAGEPSARPDSEADFFGQSVSPTAFGHDGLGGNFVWADPDSGLSVAFLTNTIRFMPFQHHSRASRLSTLAGRLLG
jgi:CubicO group peptidase (beta-lactamase class C family)